MNGEIALADPMRDYATATIDPRSPGGQMAALVSLVRPGGVVVTTTTPARDDPGREVRAISMFVRSDGEQLVAIVAKVDSGAVLVDVSETVPLADLARVHERSAAGDIRSKVVLIPPS